MMEIIHLLTAVIEVRKVVKNSAQIAEMGFVTNVRVAGLYSYQQTSAHLIAAME